MKYSKEAPLIIKNFLTYMETIKGKSEKTVNEYFLDLRTFFRYLKMKRGLAEQYTGIDEIPIDDVGIDIIKSVTLNDAYDYLNYLTHERPKFHKSEATPYGNSARTRARKVSSLRAFYKYLTEKSSVAGEFQNNPIALLELPKINKTLPRYLSVDESVKLLEAVDDKYKERNYCILTLFLNCGLRVSELVNINISDIQESTLRVMGKGSKERTIYLNNACMEAVDEYMQVRIMPEEAHKNALFVSRNRKRINVQTVKWIVKKYLDKAGLDSNKYSVHKLRHTAATLMYQNGVDVRTLKDVLGHESLDTTMIYTHLTDSNLKKAAEMNPLANQKQKK